MKVILQKDIMSLGDAGDIKEVADGYARNYLIPKKLVIPASESNKKVIDHQERLIKLKKEKRKKQSEKVHENLNGLEIVITAKVGEEEKLFGSITSIDVAKKLLEKGHSIDKRKISIDNPIKTTGEFDIQVKLDDGLTAVVKLRVDKEE
jgi:large subunit ribosomal protein L9